MVLQRATLLQLLILCVMTPPTTTLPMEECRMGLWGMNCQNQCGWCINDGGCFRKNGTCYDRMCEQDWWGEKCLEKCPTGLFGSGCTQKCPDGCFGGCSASGCDYGGCESGRMGKWCMEKCASQSRNTRYFRRNLVVAVIKADLSTRKHAGRRVAGFLEGGLVTELLTTSMKI